LFFVYTLYRWKFPDAYAQSSHMLNWKLGAVNTGVLLVSSLTMAMAVHSAAERHRKKMLGYLVVTMILGATFLGVKAMEWTADYHEGLMPTISWDPHHWPIDGNHEAGHGEAAGQGEAVAHGEVAAHSTTVGTTRHASKPETPAALGRQIASEMVGKAHISGDYLVSREGKWVPTQNIMLYFVIYFCMTGLHAIHMIIGLAILTYYVIMGSKGMFTNGNDQPVELVGLYWHIVDIIWVFLFPLLYLIGGIRWGGH